MYIKIQISDAVYQALLTQGKRKKALSPWSAPRRVISTHSPAIAKRGNNASLYGWLMEVPAWAMRM